MMHHDDQLSTTAAALRAQAEADATATIAAVESPQMNPGRARDIAYAAGILQFHCHNAARLAGWWKDKHGVSITENPLTFQNKLFLIVSECVESMEGDRSNKMDDKLPHRKMREVELADAVIRAFDLAGGYGLDLAGAIVEKMAYNADRADHKPEARAASDGKAY